RSLVPNPWSLRAFLAFDPPSEQAVVLDDQGKVRIFKTADWSPLADLPGNVDVGEARQRGAASPDGKLLAVGSSGASPMRIYDLSSRKILKEIPESISAAALEFSDTSDTLTTLSTD